MVVTFIDGNGTSYKSASAITRVEKIQNPPSRKRKNDDLPLPIVIENNDLSCEGNTQERIQVRGLVLYGLPYSEKVWQGEVWRIDSF